MTEFTRSQLNLLRKQLQETIDKANLSDITIDVGNCSYSGGEATFKVKCVLKGAKTREQIDLEYYAEKDGMVTTLIARLHGEDMSMASLIISGVNS